jgi:hypothetical protein
MVRGRWSMALTVRVEVPPRDREVLASWVRSPSIRAGLARRTQTHSGYLDLADDRRSVFSIVLAGNQIADSVVRRLICWSSSRLAHMDISGARS